MSAAFILKQTCSLGLRTSTKCSPGLKWSIPTCRPSLPSHRFARLPQQPTLARHMNTGSATSTTRSQAHLQRYKDVYKARNRALLMYTTAVVSTRLPIPTDLKPSCPTILDSVRWRGLLRSCAYVSRVLFRNWLQRYPDDVRPLRRGQTCAPHRSEEHKSPLQRR